MRQLPPSSSETAYLRLEDEIQDQNGNFVTKHEWDLGASSNFFIERITATSPQRMLTITNAGNVGIGTNNPVGKFHSFETVQNQLAVVAGDTNARSIWFVPNLGGGGYNFLSQPGDIGLIFRNQNQNSGQSGLVIAPHSSSSAGIRIAPNGNVGIGINNPQEKLDINGGINATQYFKNGIPVAMAQWQETGNDIFYDAGNVGIGTTPQANYKLVVCGPIRTHRVVVETFTCDFVFDENYPLMSLTERKKSIAEKAFA